MKTNLAKTEVAPLSAKSRWLMLSDIGLESLRHSPSLCQTYFALTLTAPRQLQLLGKLTCVSHCSNNYTI